MTVKCDTLASIFFVKTGGLKKMGISTVFFKDRSIQWLFEEEKEALSEIIKIVISNDFMKRICFSFLRSHPVEKIEDMIHEFVCARIYSEKRFLYNLRSECREKPDIKVLKKILSNKVVDYIRTKLREESCPNWKRVSDDVREALQKMSTLKNAQLRELRKDETEYRKKFIHGEKVYILNGRSFGCDFPVEFENIADEIKEKYEEVAEYLKTKKNLRIEFLCSGVISDMAESLARPFTVTDLTSILMRAVPDGFTASFSITSVDDDKFIEKEFADEKCYIEMADFGVSDRISKKVEQFIQSVTVTERDIVSMCLIEEEASACEKNRKALAEKYGITTRTVRNYEERLKAKLFKYLKDVSHEERLFFTNALLDSINGGVNE